VVDKILVLHIQEVEAEETELVVLLVLEVLV
jgi:hypothetical protein